MVKNRFLLILFLKAILLGGCSTIFEYDLGKDVIKLVAPADNLESSQFTQSFYWEKNEEAQHYRIQIAKPSFHSPEKIIVDSIVASHSFQYSFFPGKYQWRVRAENSSSVTPYSTFSLSIDTVTDISGQVLLLQMPLNSSFGNLIDITLSWQQLFSATEYNVQISSNGFNDQSSIFLDSIVFNNSFNLIVPKEGRFHWRVRAKNHKSQTAFTSPFIFTCDTTRPAKPILISPEYNEAISGIINFEWERDNAIQLSPFGLDTLLIYKDSLKIIDRKLALNETFFSDSLSEGTYFWRVKSTDKAGNVSFFSTNGKFYVN